VSATTRAGIIYNTFITLVVILAIILFDRQVMALFVGSASPAIPIARHIQLISSWTFVMFGATMVLFSTVRANGATMAPLIILAIAFYPVRIGFALIGPRFIGQDALWYAFPLGSLVSLSLSILYYRSGHWREQVLIVPPDPEEAGEHAHGAGEPAGRLNPTG
jgi:Na+-driven multidrug efflux pump